MKNTDLQDADLQNQRMKYLEYNFPLSYAEFTPVEEKVGGAGIRQMSADFLVKEGLKSLYEMVTSQLVRFVSSSQANEIAKDVIRYTASLLSKQSGGVVARKKKGGADAKKIAKKAVNFGLPLALDLGVNAGAQALGNVFLDPLIGPAAPVVSKVAAKLVRKGIKMKTGYGAKKPKTKKKNDCECDEVGLYNGGVSSGGVVSGGAKSGGVRSGGAKSGGAKSGGAKVDKRKIRGKIVSDLMKKDGLSFVDASRKASEVMKNKK